MTRPSPLVTDIGQSSRATGFPMKKLAALLFVGFQIGCAQAQSLVSKVPAPPAAAGFALISAAGAVCDGVTDDGAALQQAIDAAVAAHATLRIAGKCATSRGLVVRNTRGVPVPYAIECNNDAGLVWTGPDNSGVLLTLGDPAGKELDSAFELRNCTLRGKDREHKPATALLLHNTTVSVIAGNIVLETNDGIVCDVNCILNHFDRNYFTDVWGTPLTLIDANADWVEHNEFASCGVYCVDIQRGDSDILYANDFEGTVGPRSSNSGGTLASVHINGWAIQLIANRYEDANAAAGNRMRSVIVESDGHGSALTALFISNTYGWNITPGGPEHFVTIKRGTAKFIDEQMGNRPPGGGSIVELETPQQSVWVGGYNCDVNNIWSGRFAANGLSIAACNNYATNFMNFSRNAKVNGLAPTPGGKQPLCIDTATKVIYQGRGGAC